ncbi:MAG: PKD domain-containing protein [Owenweeksia sp.]
MKNTYSFTFILMLILLVANDIKAQQSRQVLFLGNSYTGTNNLPQLVKDVALSAGDTLVYDSHTPGGYTLENHSQNITTLNKIMAGGWEYVVMQGQSREPIIQNFVFEKGARFLLASIKQYNPCAVPMLYMTWGRENGDADFCQFYPEMCTYEDMDSTLRYSYEDLASEIDGEMSPVSVVWRYLRTNHPTIQLYQADGSHPSPAGSYAAACSFYTAIFKKDPTAISFNFGLGANEASIIRNAARAMVYDSLPNWDYKELPQSDFHYSIVSNNNEVQFQPNRLKIILNYLWDFGDGNTSNSVMPKHTYASSGTYTVTLTVTSCDLQGLHTSISDTVIEFCSHTPTITQSRSYLCNYDTLFTQPADSYQWYNGGIPIPETGPYVANYQRYPTTIFSVRSTINGCSELSEVFYTSPQWSGYYFDASAGGDPCAGDTVVIALRHISSFSGTEVIRWFRNGVPLPLADDEDTLLVNSEGRYDMLVVNPSSNCPGDTTYNTMVFDCGSLSLEPANSEKLWQLYPNPASTMVTLKFEDDSQSNTIRIYNSGGLLVQSLEVKSGDRLDIADWPEGLYFFYNENKPGTRLKLLKL